MASLLSTVTATTADPARKRRSSPDYYSSEPAAPSSDSSFFASGAARKRYGQTSDAEEEYQPRRTGIGKKPRHSEATVVPNENDYAGGMDLDTDMGAEDDFKVKEERMSDGEDADMEIKPRTALSSAATKLNQPRRKVVNSTSVKHVKAETPAPAPVSVKSEHNDAPLLSVKKPQPNGRSSPVANGAAHWSSVQESLAAPVKSGELDEVRAPVGNVKPENVLETDGSLRIFWLDQMELEGVVHLVGKVLDRNTGRYVSACVSVNGIQRNLFVKPRAKRYRESRRSSSTKVIY